MSNTSQNWNQQLYAYTRVSLVCTFCARIIVNFCLFFRPLQKSELTTNKLVKLMSYNFMRIVSQFDNQGISMLSN